MHQAINGGASIAPSEVPILKTPVATPRSFAGNHVDAVFTPAGIADASLKPIRARINARPDHVPVKACPIVARPQIAAHIAKLNFRPTVSIKKPIIGCPNV